MPSSDFYRTMAAEFRAKALRALSDELPLTWTILRDATFGSLNKPTRTAAKLLLAAQKGLLQA